MSNYTPKDGSFTVWKNDKWEKGSNVPYAKGTGKDHFGNEVEVALWIPKSEKVKGFNLTIKQAYKKNNAPQTQETDDRGINADDDLGLPF